ncbi:DUF6912 family protein [Luteipulveratus flavus]|uniref:Uncharacterized protein n=1 Tax=Luteipulveratus flavus TaxID=3031728 RepID=A0ABT6C1W6_9MICO|nr:hypothetical protein [Luteipulveratus sp. YIM 133296]MDF8262893.1 hypothetical protein [Luteipulveratus sp. YIM 133296]
MRTTRRVYFPLTATDLSALQEARHLPGETRDGFAVTEVLEQAQPSEDPEVLEFGALQDAAVAAGTGGARVVVAAADVEDAAVHEQEEGIETAVAVDGPLAQQRLVSLHLGDAGLDVTGEEDLELSWYDITELDLVVAELDR